MPTTSQLRKQLRHVRELAARDLTPIESRFMKSAERLNYLSGQMEDVAPEDVVFILNLDVAIDRRKRQLRTGNPPVEVLVPLVERIYRMCVNQLAEPEEFDTAVLMVIATIIEEVMPGPANGAGAYTGI